MLRAALVVLLDEKEISHYKVEKTQKRSCWVRSWLQRREKSLLPLVSSCHDFNLFSSKCKLSLNKYKLSSKIIIIFRFVTESVLQNMATLKLHSVLLEKRIFVATTLQHNQDFTAVFQQHFLCCEQQKSFWNHVGPLAIFLFCFRCNKLLWKSQNNVASDPWALLFLLASTFQHAA